MFGRVEVDPAMADGGVERGAQGGADAVHGARAGDALAPGERALGRVVACL